MGPLTKFLTSTHINTTNLDENFYGYINLNDPTNFDEYINLGKLVNSDETKNLLI